MPDFNNKWHSPLVGHGNEFPVSYKECLAIFKWQEWKEKCEDLQMAIEDTQRCLDFLFCENGSLIISRKRGSFLSSSCDESALHQTIESDAKMKITAGFPFLQKTSCTNASYMNTSIVENDFPPSR